MPDKSGPDGSPPARTSRRTMLAGGAAMAFGATASAGHAAAPSGATAVGAVRSGPRHVILIDWDGFDPRYIDWFDLPNVQRLIRKGAYGVASGNFKSISNPSRASMVTGSYPTTHGNYAYAYDPATNRVQGQSRFLAAETLVQALARQGRTTASVGWYMTENYGSTYGDPEHPYIQPAHPFIHRTETVIDLLNGRPVDSGGEMIQLPKIPDFLAIYGNDPDALGHSEGPNSPSMGPTMRSLDDQLGRIIEETKRVGIYGDTAFIITSDHGMSAWNKDALGPARRAIEDLGFVVQRVGSNGSPADETDVVLVAFVHTLNIHLRGEHATDENRQRIADVLRSLPEIERVVDTEWLQRLQAHPVEDLVAETRLPYGFAQSEQDLPEGEEAGSHSGLNESVLPLVLFGKGVRATRRMRDPRIVDIAPTIAALLGVEPPADATGRALDEVLKFR